MEKKQILQSFIDEKTDARMGDPAYIFSLIDVMSDTNTLFTDEDLDDGRVLRTHYLQVDEHSEPIVHRWKGPAMYVIDSTGTIVDQRWFVLGLEIAETSGSLAKEAFKQALKQGNMFVIRYIVEKLGLRVATTDALRLAAQYGHIDPVEYIVCSGYAEIMPALIVAINNGHNEVGMYLLKEVLRRLGTTGLTVMFNEPFFRALGNNGDLSLIDYIVSKGLDEESAGFLLEIAARRNNVEAVDYLLNYIVQNQWADGVDMTAIMSSAASGSAFEVIEYLMNQTLHSYAVDFWQVIDSAQSDYQDTLRTYITGFFPDMQ